MINGGALLTSDQSYALIIIFLTTIYTIKGGMFSVVATEVLQYGIMVIAGILIAGYAFVTVTDIEIARVLSTEWANVFFDWELKGSWTGKYEAFNNLIDTQGYKMFGAFIGMSLFKGIFASIAGPTPSYDMQRILINALCKRGGLYEWLYKSCSFHSTIFTYWWYCYSWFGIFSARNGSFKYFKFRRFRSYFTKSY